MNTPRVEEIINEYGRIKSLLAILKLSDEEAYKHSIEVANITDRYLQLEAKSKLFMERPAPEISDIIKGALVHDIGKAFLPFALQHSSSALSIEEKSILNIHPILGIVATKDCDFSETIRNIILLHHCNLDGTGYPSIHDEVFPRDENSSPITIPSYVWIVSYADRYDAMIHNRSFKNPKTLKESWEEFRTLTFEKKLPYQPLEIFKQIMSQDDIFEDSYS